MISISYIKESQICQKLFVFEQNVNKFEGENAKYLLSLRHFLIDKGNPQKFSFKKNLRNFETLNFCQDPAVIIGTGSADPDSDPYKNEHCR